LKSNDIPKDLQARVRKYLEYKYERESSQVDEKQALLVLSSSLRDEVLAEVNIRLIKEAQIFRSKYSEDVLVQLPFLLEEQIYGPEECIFLEGEDGREQENGENIDERCIYFLNKGQVMLCIQRTFTQLIILEKGKTFGELGFFSNLPRSASAYTLDFVYVQKLKKKDFLNILK
jgi:hyperpolarization activated cyclic nucleotide-gated potassium channel 2